MNFTKYLFLSSLVLFHILIPFTAISYKPDINNLKPLHLVKEVDLDHMKNKVDEYMYLATYTVFHTDIYIHRSANSFNSISSKKIRFLQFKNIVESTHNKTYNKTCTASKDSYQCAHPRSLVSLRLSHAPFIASRLTARYRFIKNASLELFP